MKRRWSKCHYDDVAKNRYWSSIIASCYFFLVQYVIRPTISMWQIVYWVTLYIGPRFCLVIWDLTFSISALCVCVCVCALACVFVRVYVSLCVCVCVRARTDCKDLHDLAWPWPPFHILDNLIDSHEKWEFVLWPAFLWEFGCVKTFGVRVFSETVWTGSFTLYSHN